MLESQTSVPPRTVMSSSPLNSYSLPILSVTTPTMLDVWKGPPKFQGIQAFPKQIEGKKWSITFYTKFPIVLNLSQEAPKRLIGVGNVGNCWLPSPERACPRVQSQINQLPQAAEGIMKPSTAS